MSELINEKIENIKLKELILSMINLDYIQRASLVTLIEMLEMKEHRTFVELSEKLRIGYEQKFKTSYRINYINEKVK